MTVPQPVAPDDSLWTMLAIAAPHRAAAIRMACVLEATAPKVGNVHPAAHFHDLNYSHFVAAADAAADVLSDLCGAVDVGAAIASAVAASVIATGTNVNLGIVLLLAPLVASESTREVTADSSIAQRWANWQSRTSQLLAQLDLQQGAMIASAIADANAGGLSDETLGPDHPLDVTRQHDASYDILEAMRCAASRDRIALQYANGYRDLFDHVVPTLNRWVTQTGDVLSGIVWAHIALIAEAGDSLIGRKCGQAESDRVAGLARECLAAYDRPAQRGPSIHRLDTALRADGNRLNPGTTADLIAAALYVHLRSNTNT